MLKETMSSPSVNFTRTRLRYVPVFAIANPSVVCNVRASYSGVETFGNISSQFVTWPSLDLCAKCYGVCPGDWGTLPSGALNVRG